MLTLLFWCNETIHAARSDVTLSASSGAEITLEQLAVLNDEIAALVAAGVPLDRGMLDLGRDVPGRLGRIATELGQRLEQGESLEQALSSGDRVFPPIYSAVALAGMRSGRLASALQGLSETARRLTDLRRTIGVAMIYPLLVLFLSYALFIFVSIRIVPTLVDVQRFDGEPSPLLLRIEWLGENVWLWAPWLPLVLLVFLAINWWQLSRFGTGASRPWTPWGKLRRAGCLASYAEVLSLLVAHETPLDEAVTLAGEACGDRRLDRASRRLSEQLCEGAEASAIMRTATGEIPPLIVWLLCGGRRQTDLAASLRQIAGQYHRRVERLAEWLSFYLPICLTIFVGGLSVFAYATTLLFPWYQMLRELAKP